MDQGDGPSTGEEVLTLDVRRPARTGAVVVAVRGECDVFSADVLRTELMRQVEAGRVHVVVDLTGVTFIDSTGMGVLLRARGRLAACDGRLELVVGEGSMRRLLRISALGPVFSVHRTLADALAACSTTAAH